MSKLPLSLVLFLGSMVVAPLPAHVHFALERNSETEKTEKPPKTENVFLNALSIPESSSLLGFWF